jgi:hypothetical protein
MDDNRKHRTQMSKLEIQMVEKLAHTWSSTYVLSTHTEQRMEQKKVTRDELGQTLRWGSVIEVHRNNGTDVRALMQLDEVGPYSDKVSVVISLVDGQVKTVWRNAENDEHATRDTSKYQWRTNLTNVLYAL